MSSASTTHEPARPGLGPLDEDRAQSMADEGGASAATLEGDDSLAGERSDGWILAALAGAAVALLVVQLFRRGR
jgi:hypothetical protein